MTETYHSYKLQKGLELGRVVMVGWKGGRARGELGFGENAGGEDIRYSIRDTWGSDGEMSEGIKGLSVVWVDRVSPILIWVSAEVRVRFGGSVKSVSIITEPYGTEAVNMSDEMSHYSPGVVMKGAC